MSKTRLIPLTEWADFHPWPSTPALRKMVAGARLNGFHSVVKRVGGRILIDETAFFEWVDSQSELANLNGCVSA